MIFGFWRVGEGRGWGPILTGETWFSINEMF